MSGPEKTPTMREIMDIVKTWVDGGMKDEGRPTNVAVTESDTQRYITIVIAKNPGPGD